MLNDKILYTDFPLTIKENKLYSNLGKEILDLNSLSKEELLKLISKQINLINCNKRKFMKRKFKQLPLPLEDLKDTAIFEMVKDGYRICKKGKHDLEYRLVDVQDYCNRKEEIIYFYKIKNNGKD